MNGNVNGMTIRLLGCALAMLVLAEDVVWEMK